MIRSAFVVFLLSLTLVGLELIWTRLLSAEFFYTFAFLVLSLAVAGLGLGALAVRIAPSSATERRIPILLALVALCALAGPPLVFRIGVDFSALAASPGMVARLVLTVAVLGSAYFFGGMVLAALFRRNHTGLPTLYAADLIGAGLGVVLAIVAMNRIDTLHATSEIVLPVLVAILIAGVGWRRYLAAPLLVLLLVLSWASPRLLTLDREERAPVVYEHWDAMAKVKVYAFDGPYRGLNVDNVANSPVFGFDGDFDALDPDAWDINVRYLVAQFDSCRFLSLGSGGGGDVLQALNHGATEVHAVEVNPHINRMMLDGDPDGYTVLDSTVVDSTGRLITCAELSGFLFRDPRVTVASEDARSYVRRHPGRFDVIYSLSSNTWAALASGSFALAENYLFTTEAFVDYWRALSDDGFLSMEHQVYMPRLVTQVQDALERVGVENPRDHFAVYELPRLRRKLVLVSKRPLTDELRYRAYGALTPEHQEHIRLVFPATGDRADNLIQRIILDGWKAHQDSTDVDLSPATDDRPFVAQMGLWRNRSREGLENVRWIAEFRGFPLSKITIVAILGIALVLILPLTLLPYFGRGPKLPVGAWIYFFLLGVGFMLVEIVLIQKYALFIGVPVYSLATILGTLLVASGLGSRAAPYVHEGVVFLAIAGWLVLDVLFFRQLTGVLTTGSLGARVAVSAAMIFPVGFFMGMPFPKGGEWVRERIDWGFAVNGAASVIGGALAALLAITQGFTVTLLVAAGVYLLAGWVYGLRE